MPERVTEFFELVLRPGGTDGVKKSDTPARPYRIKSSSVIVISLLVTDRDISYRV